MVWLKFVNTLKLHDREKKKVFYIKIDDHCLLNVWSEFIEHHNGEWVKKIIMAFQVVTNLNQHICLHHLCCCFPTLLSSILKVKQILDKTQVTMLFDSLPTS